MSEHLVLRFERGQPDRASWVIADSNGQRASMPETGTLADAARRAQQRPVMVLVPGQDVLLTRINLPVRGTSKMLQAVPFALEEELADNVGAMHFALGPRDNSGQVMVAAVRESLMTRWLNLLDEAGLDAICVLPDTAGIPIHDGVSILIDGADCLIRDPQGRVLVGDTEAAPAFITAMGLDDETTTGSHLYISEADSIRYAQLLSEIRLRLPETETIDLRHGSLPLMAATALTMPQPNLLQGAHTRSSGSDKLWGPWRAAAVLAGAFILVALGAKALEVMSMKSELRALNTELNELASEVLDGRIVDPMRQLEQMAASLSGGSQAKDTDFLNMLESLAGALKTTSNTSLDKLEYRNGTMDLTLTAPSVDTLDRISRDIAGNGLSAEIQQATKKPADDVVLGRLKISGLET